MAKKKNIIQRLFSSNDQKLEKRAFVNAGFYRYAGSTKNRYRICSN